jgi:hypothetical protein
MTGSVQVSVGVGIVRVPPFAGPPAIKEEPMLAGLGAIAPVERVLPDEFVLTQIQG